ncbi:DUF3108 domain-containing protein [Ruegeria sp. Ofav3-42]|uniref:DUF3108 domain-containing protein n=1 Tax=Ruegeria sp. Ofav3-42 TaxID=2917759 RepID=UPI001EF6F897|nr:DUF3108 domain-containing protein [Ruegeria sp. Ofav3-42]MCG7518797.1 DUF3108 domain-containing protein [Ruegeria sp. Ofav3-42]
MHAIRAQVLLMVLCWLPTTGMAEQSRFALRALGVKVGELVLVSDLNASRYVVEGQLTTTGLAGAIKRVRFVLEAQGRRKGARFIPSLYVEDMDTGRRISRVRLDYRNGIARASGPKISDRSNYAVTDAQQRGAVDPLTGIFMVLRDQNPTELCTLRQKLFDGERLTEIALTRQIDENGGVRCVGTFTRLAGYPPGDLRTGSRFPVSVTYEPAGSVMRATRVEAQTIYGPAVVLRK